MQVTADSMDKMKDHKQHMLNNPPQKIKITTSPQNLLPSCSICRCRQQNKAPKSYLVIYRNKWKRQKSKVKLRLSELQNATGNNLLCRIHCRCRAELLQWQTIQGGKPASKIWHVLLCFCFLVSRGRNHSLLATHIYPKRSAWHHVWKCKMPLALYSPVSRKCTSPFRVCLPIHTK